jgi:cell division protein DivIC
MYTDYSKKKQEPRNQGTRRRLRLLMVALFCFMGWAALTYWNQEDKVNAKITQLSALENKLEETRKLNEEYKREIIRLNDDEYIEQKVRKDFQMTRPGDTLYIKPKSSE